MTTRDVPRICGGTFFLQVLRMKKPKVRRQAELLEGDIEPLSNQRILEAMIRIFYPKFNPLAGDSFKGDVSDYRACKESDGENLPFTQAYYDFSHFDEIIVNDYARALRGMKYFVNQFINTDNKEKMYSAVKAILQCIADDKTTDGAIFYMGEMGNPITKEALINSPVIVLEPFLLGVWHFILLNRPNNSVGRETFEDWNTPPKTQGQRWKYVSDIGKHYHKIDILLSDGSTVSAEEIYEEPVVEELEEDAEIYESEVVEDPEFLKYKEDFYKPVSIVINNWNNAPNGIQAQYIGTINITR